MTLKAHKSAQHLKPYSFKPGNKVGAVGRNGSGGVRQRRALKRKAKADAQAQLVVIEVAALQKRVNKLERALNKQMKLWLQFVMEQKNDGEKNTDGRSGAKTRRTRSNS